jgi:hypothetical protein
MDRKKSYEVSPEGAERIEAVDGYLEEAIRGGRPIEALIATKWLGEIVGDRAKEAARVATEGSSSWTDVGRALGMTRQAAHEKLRTRVRDEIDKGRAQVERAEEAGRNKIERRAARARERLDAAAPFSPKIDTARQRVDEWEREQHAKLDRKLTKARETLTHAERSAQDKVDRKVGGDPS